MAVGHSHTAVLLLLTIGSVYMQGLPPCELPFFESGGVCVRTCPEFQIGNHLSGVCEPLPDNYMVALNATLFRATAIVNASLGMPVIYFKTTINNTFFQNPDVVTITVIRNDETDSIFKLENGDNTESITNLAFGSNEVITIERAVIYSSDPSQTTELPATFDFDVNVAAAKTVDGGTLSEDAQALGVVIVREICEPNPCENNGTCTPQGLEFTCECSPGFAGATCETDLAFCQDVTCMNDGICVEGFGTETECLCVAGFTGPLCEIDLSACSSNPCLNGGSCIEEAGLSFSCTCSVGYTGEICQTDLDFCQNDTCDNDGSCQEGPGSETTCDCVLGFTGAVCEIDLDFCQNDTCLNGGVCVEGDGAETTCNCTEGFSGLECEVDLDIFCQNGTCMNGGNCTEGVGPEVSCVCLEGFDGSSCEIDLAFCETDTCSRNGNCSEGLGTETICNCFPGYSGLSCEMDVDTFCMSNPCGIGGLCNEGPGDTFTCDCFPGYSGSDCSTDLDFCTPELCLNDGICIENIGEIVTCLCAPGFTGSNCRSDDPGYVACNSEICFNGGSCMEEFGPVTSCNCASGFSGSACENDLDVCQSTFCENNGTCNEGVGDSFNCSCQAGYTGDNCTEDDDEILFCESNNMCQNGATCLEGFGPDVSCDCAPGFSGVECEIDLDFCPFTTCQNGGMCQEGAGNLTACNCNVGYAGVTCEDDDQNYVGCALDSCANGGTCIELFGPSTRCMCPEGFNGTTCEDNDQNYVGCALESCVNGGMCIELFGPSTRCMCPEGFNGTTCEDTVPPRGIIGVPTYVFWIIVGVAVGVIVIALYLVICLICVVHYKRKRKKRTYAFEGGNTSELPLTGFEHVAREGVRTTRNEEMNASTGSLGSNLSDSSDSDSVDAMATVLPYATVNANRAATQNPTNEISPYATLQNPDGNPGAPTSAANATNTINPYATLHNPANANNQTTTAATVQSLPNSDHPPASAQKNPDPPYATIGAKQPYAKVTVTFAKPAERTGAPGETNPLESITEPAGPLVPERTPKMFETATPPVTPEMRPSASPATAVTAGPGSNTSSPTDLPSPRHTSTPIQTPAHLDHSTVITNPTAVQSIGDALSTSDSGTGRVTWSLDPTSASTSETFVGSANEDLSVYANKSALLAIAASTALALTGSDGSTVVANPAAVDVMDGPNPPVLAFGKEGSPISQQPAAPSDLEQRSPLSQEIQSETALQQAIQHQLEEHSQKQIQGLQESFERYTLQLEQQLTWQQKNWEEEMRRRKEEEDWARREKERVEKMMDSQWQSGSFSEFGRSTSPISPSSPTSPTPSDSEGEMAQLRKVAAASTGIQKADIQRQELLTPSSAVKVTIPPKSPPRDDSIPTSSPLRDAKLTPPFLPPSLPDAVSAPPPLKETPPLTQPFPPPPQLTTPLPLKQPLPAPPPSKDTAAAPPPLKATRRVPPPKPSRDSLPAPPIQGSVPPRPPPPPPPPPPPTDTSTAAHPRSSAWPPAPVLPPPPHLDSLSPSASLQRPTIPAPTRRKPMILPPPGIRYITLTRPDMKTSFGFVVLSNTKRKGCVISRLVPDSPAHSCGELFIMDEVLAVNGQDVCSMDHAAILALIKNSGTTVQLTVQQPKIIIKRRPRSRRNLSNEFSASGPLRRFESIQEVDEEEEEDDDDVFGEGDDKPSRFQRTWSLPIGNKEAKIMFPSSQYVHSTIPSHVDTSQQPSHEASLLHVSPQASSEQSQQAASGKEQLTPGTRQNRPVVEQYDDVHFVKHKPPKLLEAPAPVQFDESKVRFGKSHVSPNQHKKNVKHDTLSAGADSELKAALRVRRKQLMQNEYDVAED